MFYGRVTRGQPTYDLEYILQDKNKLFGLLTAACWTRVGRVLAACWTRVGRVLAVCWTCVGLVLAACWPCVGRVLDLCWPSNKQSYVYADSAIARRGEWVGV